MVELLHTPILLVHLLFDALRQIGCIYITEIIELSVAYGVHCASIIAKVCIDDRKVEIDDEILVAVGCRMLADIQVAIQSLELVNRIDVIIMTEHRQGEALAETAGADEEKVLVGFFYLLDKPCLIDIVTVVLAYCHEVHHTVRYSLCLFFYRSFVHNRDAF